MSRFIDYIKIYRGYNDCITGEFIQMKEPIYVNLSYVTHITTELGKMNGVDVKLFGFHTKTEFFLTADDIFTKELDYVIKNNSRIK